MRPLRIALLDLNHSTRGVTTNTVPLGIGLIAAYLDIKLDPKLLDIRLYKFHEAMRADLSDWIPDVAGIALFNHNTSLNLFNARFIKTLNPKCFVIAGGPNQPVENPRRNRFLSDNPVIDLCCTQDGEIPFSQAVGRILSGQSARDLRSTPVDGGYALHPESEQLAVSAATTPRLPSLDVFGPLYAQGFFDSFLDQGCHPYIQTHRGCPFSCAFCTSGDPWHSRIRFLSPDIFAEEMRALGRRFAGRPEIAIQLANTNMSLFEEDFAIAEILARSQRDFGWPATIHTNSGKDTAKLLRMQRIVSFVPDVALQTLTPAVLQNIGRRNIPLEEFQALQGEMTRQGRPTATELILSLPGETRESFLDTVAQVARTGVQRIVIYTQMHLAGTALATREWEERGGFVVRHRVVPRTFSRIDGELVLDTEEVVVGTKDMPMEDYFELRALAFTLDLVFNAIELSPIRRLIIEQGGDPWEWIRSVHEALPKHPGLAAHYQAFMAETRGELFDSRQELLDFYARQENEKALFEGRLGDNLLRKYKFQVLSKDYLSCLEVALQTARDSLAAITQDTSLPGLAALIADLRTVLELRDYRLLHTMSAPRAVRLEHDVPLWLSCETGAPLTSLSGSFAYQAIPNAAGRERLARLASVHEDEELTLQLLFQYMENDCLWPVWRPAKAPESAHV